MESIRRVWRDLFPNHDQDVYAWPPPPPPSRRYPSRVVASSVVLYAHANDGTLWRYHDESDSWTRIADLPDETYSARLTAYMRIYYPEKKQ